MILIHCIKLSIYYFPKQKKEICDRNKSQKNSFHYKILKMKRLIFSLFIIISFSTFSQSSVEFNYNDVYIGRNLGVSWKKSISNLSLSAGTTFHLNQWDKIPIGVFIQNSGYAKNLGQRFGLQLGLEYFFIQNSFVKLGVFYTNQTSFIDQVHKMYYVHDTLVSNPHSEFDFSYIKSERTFGPVLTCDNIIGLSLQSKITNHIYLTTKAGLGILFWKNTDKNVILTGDFSSKGNLGYNFTNYLSMGVGYTFQK